MCTLIEEGWVVLGAYVYLKEGGWVVPKYYLNRRRVGGAQIFILP
jgi:hypothetical protein